MLEDERSKSGGTPATSVDALMSVAHADKASVGGVLVHMPHVCMAERSCVCAVPWFDLAG